MAEPVALDPAGHDGTYKLVGGFPAVDFANLVSYRATDREHDWLVPAANLARWRDAAGLDGTVVASIDELRDTRELLASVFDSVANGHPPETTDLDRLSRLARADCQHRRLAFEAGDAAATWSHQRPSLTDQLVADAVAVITSPEVVSRLAACGECRWVFLDMSRNRSRRWCDPADCGNRARQRRHYQRHHPR